MRERGWLTTSGLALTPLAFAALLSAGATASATSALPPCDESAVTTAASVTTASVTTAPVTTAAGTTTQVATSTTLLPGWVSFASPEGDFHVAFPATPQSQSVDAPTADGGSVPITITSAEGGDRAYLVSSGVIPVGGTFSLEGGRDGMIANVGGTAVCSNPTELQGWPGIEAIATVSSGGVDGTLLGRIVQTDNSFYQIAVVGSGTFDFTDPDVMAFLESFTLTTAAP
jgi:hypothetical protein